jgi:hypothetical protein
LTKNEEGEAMFGHPSSFPLLLNGRDAVEDLWYQMVKMMLFDCSCSFSSGLVLMLFFFLSEQYYFINKKTP